jgi:D-alanyl-D-alanine carboxypeptidase
MIEFDPVAMMSPLVARADAIRSAAGAPAVLIEVSRGGRTASTVTGVEDIGTGAAARGDQTFEVGSQTKMMTAVALLQMEAEGLVDLDDPISAHLPGFTDGLANADTATIRQLITMRSGIPAYPDAVDASGTPLFVKWLEDHPGEVFGPDQALAIARGMGETHNPGDFHYNNTNYLLLGLLIEKLTGKPWAEVLEERIFDPAGMTSSSADQFDSDPLRLSSYAREDGRLVEVTDALWAPKGESGVISTTHDLIAFERALLVDKTLLPADALAAMTNWVKLFTQSGDIVSFGLGIFQHDLKNGQIFQGFAGGTLGTSTVTYCNPDDDSVIAMAVTVAGAPSDANAKQLDTILRGLDAWAPVEDDGSALAIRSVSAAGLTVATNDAGGARLAFGGACLDLVRGLRQLDAGATVFEDGSVLVVGDGTSAAGDDDANTISIPKQFHDALQCHNYLIGLGGDDRLVGGWGGDRLAGNTGHDRLAGNGGDDRLSGGWAGDTLIGGNGDDGLWGGGGWDVLQGRNGSDYLVGGGGRDTFRFDDGDSTGAAPDTIRDFDPSLDLIDLKRVDAVAGGRDSAFHWIGASGFSGTAGELRGQDTGSDLRLEADTDGDGQSDLAIILHDIDTVLVGHFLL